MLNLRMHQSDGHVVLNILYNPELQYLIFYGLRFPHPVLSRERPFLLLNYPVGLLLDCHVRLSHHFCPVDSIVKTLPQKLLLGVNLRQYPVLIEFNAVLVKSHHLRPVLARICLDKKNHFSNHILYLLARKPCLL